MRFPDKKTVETLRTQFPVGCRVVLDRMEDAQAPALGTQGTCRGVDDAGNVMVSWDTGGSLNVAYGADSCHRVASEAEVKESTTSVRRDRRAHVAHGAALSRTVTTTSSKPSAATQRSWCATPAVRSKRWKIFLEKQHR